MARSQVGRRLGGSVPALGSQGGRKLRARLGSHGRPSMAGDQDVRPPRRIFPEGRGTRLKVWWPTPTAPPYVLAWGELGPPPQLPSCSVATFEGDGSSEGQDHIWGHRSRGVSSDELRAWLLEEAKVEPEAGPRHGGEGHRFSPGPIHGSPAAGRIGTITRGPFASGLPGRSYGLTAGRIRGARWADGLARGRRRRPRAGGRAGGRCGRWAPSGRSPSGYDDAGRN